MFLSHRATAVVTALAKESFEEEGGLSEPSEGSRENQFELVGKKMVPALNYLWSCCYFDYDGTRTACMVISRGLQQIAQEFSTVASTSSRPAFSQTTKPK